MKKSKIHQLEDINDLESLPEGTWIDVRFRCYEGSAIFVSRKAFESPPCVVLTFSEKPEYIHTRVIIKNESQVYIEGNKVVELGL